MKKRYHYCAVHFDPISDESGQKKSDPYYVDGMIEVDGVFGADSLQTIRESCSALLSEHTQKEITNVTILSVSFVGDSDVEYADVIEVGDTSSEIVVE